MDYRLLAQRACARGEDVRAIVILVQGIKRQAEPLHDLLSLLLEIYTQHVSAPGTEDDILRALLTLDEPTRTLWIQEALEIFEESDHPPLQDAFTRALEAHRIPLPSHDPVAPDATRHRATVHLPTGRRPSPLGAHDAAQDVRPSPTTPRSRPLAPSRLVSLGLVLLVAGIASGVLWFLWGGDGDQTAIFDRQIEAFDFSTLPAFQAAIPPHGRSAAMQERAEFLETLVLTESTPPKPHAASPPTSPGRDSVWGETARLLRLYHHGAHEAALGILGVLERRHPTSLPTLWARALVHEWEGNLLEAQVSYASILKPYPRFVQGHAALLRLAYKLGDHAQAARHRQALATHNPHHPYLHLRLPTAPQTLDLFLHATPPPQSFGPEVELDRFTRSLSLLSRALTAWSSGQIEACRTHTQALHLQDPNFFFVPMLQGALATLDHMPEAAADAFARAIAIPGLHASYRLALASIAPQFLTLLGFPELGFALTFNPPGSTAHRLHAETLHARDRATLERLRPLALGLSEAQAQATPELRAHALFTLGYVLLESGSLRDAKLFLGELRAPETLSLAWRFNLLDLWIAHREGRLDRLKALAGQVKGGGDADRLATLLVSLSTHTSHDDPVLVGDRSTHLSPVWQHLRLEHALSQGQVKEVLSLLDALEQAPLHKIALATLRQRARARLDLKPSPAPPLAPPPPRGTTPTLDLAVALMWSGHLDQARQSLERVLSLAPKHPQANWFMALMLHRARKYTLAAPYFVRAGVEDPETLPRFWRELGTLHLATGDFPRAQQAFYQEVLMDKKSVGALERLGQVYLEWNKSLGKRDFSRILAHYRAQVGLKRQTGELLKWLARFHGSRRGTEEGLAYLNQAIRVAGPRADLLSEKALGALANAHLSASRTLFLQALRKDTMHAPAHLGLATVMEEEGQRAKAIQHYKEFLMLDPYHPDVSKARARLQQLEEATEKGSP